MKGKYLAMSMIQLRAACTTKSISQIGTRDDIVRKMVERERPIGGWGSSSTSSGE